MDATLNNVNGMGAVKFPTDSSFGSGDIPIGFDKKIFTFEEYLDYMKSLNEESVMDKMKSKDKNRTPEKQNSDYINNEKRKLSDWQRKRKEYYLQKLKDAKTPEEKKLLKNQFKLEVIKKKRALNDKLKKKRVDKSKKNLRTS